MVTKLAKGNGMILGDTGFYSFVFLRVLSTLLVFRTSQSVGYQCFSAAKGIADALGQTWIRPLF